MIDFSKINAFDKGQRDSFETLVCVLANREPPTEAYEFQPNDGRGGDGGVEALWLLTDGEKVGYQSKFFDSFAETQLKQMDKSVAQALKTHPELKKYVFAIPFDPTADRGPKAKGKSEWEKWNDRVADWQKLAATHSVELEFELWPATILSEKLFREENTSIRKHWFGGDVLNKVWFEQRLEAATQALHDRFNPGDHVEVSVEALFDTIARGPGITSRLESAFVKLEKSRVPNIEFTTTDHAPDPDALAAANEAWPRMVELKASFPHDFLRAWDVSSANDQLAKLREAVWTLERQYLSTSKGDVEKDDKRKLEAVSISLRDLLSSCYELSEVLESSNLLAESTQCALVYGPAGAGKSHLLAQVAEQRTNAGLPTVLLLGQSFSNAFFWEQTGALLGLEGRTAEEVLGALNAVGVRKGERVLLLFDAINEGVGSTYWRENLPEIVGALRKYSHLSAVFSCREEYLPYAVPKELSTDLPKIFVNGFSSPAELEQAAIRYLDSKGIARPNTPWLSPEFSNPLFLKSVSEALHAKGRTEFPKGLHGISEVMALYLDALSWRTEANSANPEEIATSIKKLVRLVAEKMASDGCDFVEVSDATILAEESFKARTPPPGKTWLQVMAEASLFRLDPPPYQDDVDPFDPPPELVRFAFQRFQDHLTAMSLCAKVVKGQEAEAFSEGGPLSFLFYQNAPEQGFRYEFAGLVSALSTIYPEKLGVEFAKTLPNWERHWDDGHPVQEGFGESFKWRSADAFSEDTRELLNRLNDYHVDPLGLLLEVSMTVEHPFNALRLHSQLKRLDMPERDSFWSRWINSASREEFNQVERIISWSLALLERSADAKHLELAAVVLTWSLSSSHMTLRDRATKALTAIFLANSGIFEFVLEKMFDCDDPYVIERLYAAAFGACCIEPNPERLNYYSRAVFAKVFVDGNPPIGLLTRDYALGIIELADNKCALSSDVSLAACYHPFSSKAPVFGLKEEEVEKIADERGGKEIFRSASSEWGDYGKYSIPVRVRSFLTTPISQPAPLNCEQLKTLFYKTVIEQYPERVRCLELLENTPAYSKSFLVKFLGKKNPNDAEALADQYISARKEARRELEDLLSVDEIKQLSNEYFRDGKANESYDSVSVQQCRLWITKRAYELGWTADLFPQDGHGTGYSRHENDIERIGKKYQRIALDEIQARLADNFWAQQGWPEEPCVYRYSHHDYRRNLEPTILPTDSRYARPDSRPEGWIVEPIIKLPEVVESDLKKWPFSVDPIQSMADKLRRVDNEGKRWIVLYEFNLDRQSYPEPRPGEHGTRYEEFRFLYCVFLRRGKAQEFAEYLDAEQGLDVHSFQPRDFTDGPFLLEAHWRDTWQSEKFGDYFREAPDGCDFAIPIANYYWESHLDKTLPDGFSNYMPQQWFANELELSVSRKGPHAWNNKAGELTIQAHRPFEHQTAVVIDEKTLFTYAEEYDVEPVWLMIAERNTWPNGSNDESCWRRSEGAVWQDGDSWRQVGWNKDTKR